MIVMVLSFFVFSGCSSENYEGEWVFKDGDEGCSETLTFISDTMTFDNGLTKRIEKLEGDTYSFNPGMGMITIELKKLENDLLYLKEGNRNCNYQRKQ